YTREQEILRLLYLISLYDSGHIQTIQFLDEGITITYTNNKQTQFYFEMVRVYNKDGFENKIADNLNTMLIVSEDPSVEGNEDTIVKYYLFDLGHIQTIQFLDEGITITYTNNKQTQFYFEMVRVYNKDGFENKIADNLNTMLIVSEDPSVEGNEDTIVKYYLFDLGHIQTIQFLDEGITITYTNNKQTQFYFETVRAYNKDGFENKIADNLNTMLIVSEDPSIESNEDAIVKYYSFDLDIEENIDPKEENNKDDHANFDLKEGKE
ncbi:13049_t:CDS:2, partial [Dentiscutata heterogama]